MRLPIWTNSITVKRYPTDPERDPTDELPDPVTTATKVRAVIAPSRGDESVSSGAEQEVVYFRLTCDPVDLDHRDIVVDEDTGETFEVVWVRGRVGFGLDHTRASLKAVSGIVSEPRLVVS